LLLLLAMTTTRVVCSQAFALLDPEDLLLSLDEASAGQEGATPSELADIRRLLYRLPRIGSTPGAQPPPASKAKVGLVQQLLPGGLAGAFAQSVVQPVETLKVRAPPGRLRAPVSALLLRSPSAAAAVCGRHPPPTELRALRCGEAAGAAADGGGRPRARQVPFAAQRVDGRRA
jgi:hypothetical protein